MKEKLLECGTRITDPEKVGAEKKGFKNKVAQARNKAIARRNKRKADKAERDKAVAQARDTAIARRNARREKNRNLNDCQGKRKRHTAG